MFPRLVYSQELTAMILRRNEDCRPQGILRNRIETVGGAAESKNWPRRVVEYYVFFISLER